MSLLRASLKPIQRCYKYMCLPQNTLLFLIDNSLGSYRCYVFSTYFLRKQFILSASRGEWHKYYRSK